MIVDGGSDLYGLSRVLDECESRWLVDTSVLDVLADDGTTAEFRFHFDGAVLEVRVTGLVSYRLIRCDEGLGEAETRRRLTARGKEG